MRIQITRTFTDPALSPHPVLQSGRFDLPEALAEQLIADGKAKALDPAKRERKKRETAIR